jgi:hypothetical protein
MRSGRRRIFAGAPVVSHLATSVALLVPSLVAGPVQSGVEGPVQSGVEGRTSITPGSYGTFHIGDAAPPDAGGGEVATERFVAEVVQLGGVLERQFDGPVVRQIDRPPRESHSAAAPLRSPWPLVSTSLAGSWAWDYRAAAVAHASRKRF